MEMTMANKGAVATVLLLQAWMDTLVTSAVERRARTGQAFNALWVPIVIVMAGAAAMTIWCTVRGYNGWEFQLTWRGFRARCVN